VSARALVIGAFIFLAGMLAGACALRVRALGFRGRWIVEIGRGAARDTLIDEAWRIIASVGERYSDGWAGQGPEWQSAAQRWRDQYTERRYRERPNYPPVPAPPPPPPPPPERDLGARP